MASLSMIFLWILLVILVIVVVISAIFSYVRLKRKIPFKIPPNPVIIINNIIEQSEGYIFGIMIEASVGRKRRIRIRYLGIDEETENLEEPKIITTIIEPKRIVVSPRGTRSMKRDVLELLPKTIKEIEDLHMDEDTKRLLQMNVVSKNTMGSIFDWLDAQDKFKTDTAMTLAGSHWMEIRKGIEDERFETIEEKLKKLKEIETGLISGDKK